MKHRRISKPFGHAEIRRKPAVIVSAVVLAGAAAAGVLLDHANHRDGRGDSASVASSDLRLAGGDQTAGGDLGAATTGSGGKSSTTGAAAAPKKAPTAKKQGSAKQAPKQVQGSATAPASPPPTQAPAEKVLDYQYQAQVNYYYCGPAATRIALTARGQSPSQDTVAVSLHTTTSGTDSANDTTRALNSMVGTNFYQTHEIPGDSATPAQMDQLQADVVHAVSNGYAVVSNVVGSVTDTSGGWHSYGGGHFLTIVGYQDQGRTVKIADPANPNNNSYWVTTINMANWMAHRGYSA
jgi:hypothetical protein